MPAATLTRTGALPRFITPRSPERATLGPRLADVAAALGKPFMPWQHMVADVALELDPDTGYLAYDTVVLVVMRQQGKSELTLPLMTHRSLGFDKALTDWTAARHGVRLPAPGAQRTMYLAQGAEEARDKWRDVHLARIQRSPLSDLLVEARLRQNHELMVFANGSTWLPGSQTAKSGGTGDTLDLGVIDEAWSHDARTELGLRPTMLTRPWRQMWVVSMIPGPKRRAPGQWAYLRSKMEKGRARVEAGIRKGICYIEFSAEPGMDPGDPATWWSCMPALGRTIPESAVASDFDNGDFSLADFEAEYLGWEPKVGSPQWLVVPHAIWTGLVDQDVDRPTPVALCVDAAEDQATATIGLAGLVDSDSARVEVSVVDRRAGLSWVVDRVMALVDDWSPCAIVINPSGPAAPVIDPLQRALDEAFSQVPLLKPSGRQCAAADARFVAATGVFDDDPAGDDDEDVDDAVRARRISHWAQPELDAALGVATRKYTGKQWRFEAAIDGADLAPLRAVSLAMWAGDHTDWAGADYDIMSSLG